MTLVQIELNFILLGPEGHTRRSTVGFQNLKTHLLEKN